MPLDALIFDFDGLIVDTETPEALVWREVFREHGQTLPDDYWNDSIGRGAEQVKESPLQLLNRLTEEKLDIQAVDKTRERRLYNMIAAEPARRGVVSLLKEAKSAGMKLAVASSSKHWWVDGHLERLNLKQYFQHIVCADDVPRAKPFPDLYLKAASKLQVGLAEVMAFEDSPHGIASAKAAGIFVVAVPNSMTATLDLTAADVRFESLDGVGIGRLFEIFHF
ncbi:MAG: HAD family hydrolase [Fimbriimonas sp.]|nr:HAD family hydrolase [Fimbriimonas sp.]